MEKIIKIHLTERTDYINKYNQRILSYDLSNYILEELKGIDTKEKIKFFIESNFEMTDLEKTNLVDMIRNNYGADISEILNISKKTSYYISTNPTNIYHFNYYIFNDKYRINSPIYPNTRMGPYGTNNMLLSI